MLHEANNDKLIVISSFSKKKKKSYFIFKLRFLKEEKLLLHRYLIIRLKIQSKLKINYCYYVIIWFLFIKVRVVSN